MSGDSRVLIPNNVRKMIQEIKKVAGKNSEEYIYKILKECDMDPNKADMRFKMIAEIREIAGKHSDDDIHTMLKECNMDPNEAAQRLLYIDTFHEVKSKRDRRKVNASSGVAYEEYRGTRGNQWRGTRGGRGNYYSSNVPDDVDGVRTVSSRNENGVTGHTERVSRPTMPVLHETENNVAPHVTKSSTASVNGTTIVSNGCSNHGLSQQLSADPVLVPSMNSRKTCAVGTIECEIGNKSSCAKSGATLATGIRSSIGQDFGNTSQLAAEIINSNNGTRRQKSLVVEKSQLSESSQLPLLSTSNDSPAAYSNQDSQPAQQLNGPSKVVVSESAAVASANSQSVPEKKVFEKSTPKLGMMLEKLTLSHHQPVIFPDNLQVPETLKSRLTFGSLDAVPSDEGSRFVSECVEGNSEAVMEPSLSQNLNPADGEGEFVDNLLPTPHVSENVLPSEDNISSDSALKHVESKQEIMPPLGGLQHPLLQITPDYNLSLMPHVLGPHFVQIEVPEPQGGNSQISSALGSTPSSTQPVGVVQSTPALSPPLFPYFRHPYAPNYIPYNPYFPHVYFPQNAHQLLGHSGFLQQPSTGNVYVQSAAATATPGVKLPVPSLYKQGTIAAGNLTHFGIPSGYGSYGTSPVGYSAAVAPGNSSSSEDLTALQTKEKDFHFAMQQGEDSQVLAPAPGRDIPSLLPNYFYNYPRGHHVALSPAQTGLYHQSQTVTAQSTGQPLLHQSQSMAM